VKDALDNLTFELPFKDRPVHVVERMLREKNTTLAEAWRIIEEWEKAALKTANLELLIGIKEWKKIHSRRFPYCRIKDNLDYYPPWC